MVGKLNDQALFHSLATIASLLLQIGEVGKKFSGSSPKSSTSMSNEQCLPNMISTHVDVGCGVSEKFSTGNESSIVEEYLTENKASSEVKSEEKTETEVTTTDDNMSNNSPVMALTFSKHDTLFSDLSQNVGESCTSTSEDCDLSAITSKPFPSTYQSSTNLPSSPAKPGQAVDDNWSITFEQFVANILTEHPLVQYFENHVDLAVNIKHFRERRISEKTSVSDISASH